MTTFAAVYREHAPFVLRSLIRLGVHSRDVEDVAHDTFVKVGAKLGDYDPTRSMRAWLWVFCRRAAKDYRELARHRGRSFEERTDRDASRSEYETSVAARDLVTRALEKMSDEERELLILHELEGFSLQELGAHFASPISTVHARVARARARFLLAYRELSEDQEVRDATG